MARGRNGYYVQQLTRVLELGGKVFDGPRDEERMREVAELRQENAELWQTVEELEDELQDWRLPNGEDQ